MNKPSSYGYIEDATIASDFGARVSGWYVSNVDVGNLVVRVGNSEIYFDLNQESRDDLRDVGAIGFYFYIPFALLSELFLYKFEFSIGLHSGEFFRLEEGECFLLNNFNFDSSFYFQKIQNPGSRRVNNSIIKFFSEIALSSDDDDVYCSALCNIIYRYIDGFDVAQSPTGSDGFSVWLDCVINAIVINDQRYSIRWKVSLALAWCYKALIFLDVDSAILRLNLFFQKYTYECIDTDSALNFVKAKAILGYLSFVKGEDINALYHFSSILDNLPMLISKLKSSNYFKTEEMHAMTTIALEVHKICIYLSPKEFTSYGIDLPKFDISKIIYLSKILIVISKLNKRN